MPSITLRNVSFHYESPYNDVFTGLDLLIDTRWRTALVGRNGQGKSTLLGLIEGALTPGLGEIGVPVKTLRFPAPVARGLTVSEAVTDAFGPYRQMVQEMEALLAVGDEPAIARYSAQHEEYLALGGYEVDASIAAEFERIGLNTAILDRPFETLSGGEQTRALIVSLFADATRFPLIDEPTNHLDMQGREDLADYLAGKEGFLLVSHDRAFLDRTCDHVVSINKSDVRVNRGNYSRWQQHMAEEHEHEARTRENLEREIRDLRQAASQRRAGAHQRESDKYGAANAGMRDTGFIGRRAAKQMKRALAVERRIDAQLDEKASLLKNAEKSRTLSVKTAGGPGRLLSVQNVAAQAGRKRLFNNVSLQLTPGDRIAITGPNGCGKSTLLDIIAGEREPDAGIVRAGPGVTISRALQIPLWQAGSLRAHLKAAEFDETRFRQLLGTFGVEGDLFDRDLETFSQGQLKKVDLVRSLMVEAEVFIWDEPLNYIDLMSREQIEAALLADSATMVFVEHDRHFIESVATDILDLSNV